VPVRGGEAMWPPRAPAAAIAAGAMAGWPVTAWTVQNVEDFPNLLAGSFTDGQKFSTGNTFPIIARPWGFNHWSIQTNNGATAWWFGGSAHEFHWIRLTHQPSPWIGDWGYVLFGPQMGGRVDEPVMFFHPWGARIKPYVLDATLGPDNMRVQLTPSIHGAILKVSFPEFNPQRNDKRICFKLPPNKKKESGRFERADESGMLLELTATFAEQVPKNFGLKLRAEVDPAARRYFQRISKSPNLQCFDFSAEAGDVTVRIGTSLISSHIAQLNLEREVGGLTFEGLEDDSRMSWRSLLRRVDIVDPGPMTEQTFRRVGQFYTGLYRALLFPRRLDEIDASGKVVHYSPYDPAGGVHDGVLVTDTGFWDTFRTVFPLLTLVYPEEAGVIMAGWLNAFKEGGWLPEWSSPSYRSCMVGTYASVTIADAVLKGLPGIDHELAWKAMAKDAFEPGGGKGQGGKANYKDYDTMGYIPWSKSTDAVSGTLDFAFSDFAVSVAAAQLGHQAEADRLQKRAHKARSELFDSSSGLMRPKNNGMFKRDDPSQWGAGFTEGSAWHHSFPPFDLQGLAKMHGSRSALASQIKAMLSQPGSFKPGSYRRTIHEMEEMRALGFGQYGHSNQPVHHILWLLLMLDEARPECNATRFTAESETSVNCPRLIGEAAIAQTLQRAYGVDFFAGDEDNGEMGAWFVLASLGLFEVAPGTHQGYTLGSPLFRRVDIYNSSKIRSAESGSASLSIRNRNAGTNLAVHISQVLVDGSGVGAGANDTHLSWTLSYERLLRTKVLQFVTAHEPRDEPGAAKTDDSSAADQQRAFELQQRVSMLEKELQAQRMGAREALNSALGRPEPADKPAADGSKASCKTEMDMLVSQKAITLQLQQQLESLRRQSTAPTDTDAMPFLLLAMVCTLIAVNLLGWFCFVHWRKSRRDPGRSSSTARGIKTRTRRTNTNGKASRDSAV